MNNQETIETILISILTKINKPSMRTFKAKWTGSFPNLCSGHWELYKHGKDISHIIPNNLKKSPMGTAKTYRACGYKMGEEYSYSYENGLHITDWIEENDWIDDICDNYEEKIELFLVINAEDWRYGSCGGCI